MVYNAFVFDFETAYATFLTGRHHLNTQVKRAHRDSGAEPTLSAKTLSGFESLL